MKSQENRAMEERKCSRGREKNSSSSSPTPERLNFKATDQMEEQQPKVIVNVNLLKPPTITNKKKLQIFYYLTRNGQLEQPHFIELTHFPNHHLRLKDVMDRLTLLRGKAMASLYSWSCKRSYKSGYVWNDLSENDIIYPAEGAEYVLKGSELVQGCSEKLQQVHVSNKQQVSEPSIQIQTQSKTRRQLAPSPLREVEVHHHPEYEEYDEVEEYEYEDGEKISYTSSTTPHSRCSRGVSTEELEEHETQKLNESTRLDSSRLSVSTASPIILNQQRIIGANPECGNSNRLIVKDDNQLAVAPAPTPSRNSVLLQFIACGRSAVWNKAKNAAPSQSPSPSFRERVGKTESFGRGVVCKVAGNQLGEEDMIKYMSENPRFGNLQSEEKEYFSGSILESIRDKRHVVQPVLKKSNSYKEERSMRTELEETTDREENSTEACGVKGKCIPRMISFTSKQDKKP